MPVRYSDLSAGPSTRAAGDITVYTSSPDLSGMKKAELQAEAEAQGLSTSGTKADLIERLNA